jgi:protein O-GlcNAc transferase
MNKPGRNEACPCGSGKKYKQCCMLKEGNNPVVVTASPEAPTLPALLQAGLSHHQAGRLADAETFYRQILQREPKHADALHLLGVIAYQVQQYDAAVHLFEQAIAAKPDNPAYHVNLGSVRQDQGSLKQAIGHYRHALVLQPDYPEAHNNLGNALLAQGENQAAIESYLNALRYRSDYAQAHNNLGSALQAQDQLDRAISHYRQALALDPQFLNARINLGNVLQQSGELDAAIESYRQVLATHPELAQVHHHLANALQAQQDKPAAMASYRRAIELKPDYAEAYFNLGNMQRDAGEPIAAIALYRQAIALKTDYAQAHYNLGIVLDECGEIDAAAQHYRYALDHKPDYTEAYNNFGRWLASQGRLDDAIDAYQQALQHQPDYVEAHNNWGIVLEEKGQLDAAMERYRQALAIRPDYAIAHNNLGRSWSSQGKFSLALQSFRRALELQPDFDAAYSNVLFHLNHDAAPSSADYLAQARGFGAVVAARAAPYLHARADTDTAAAPARLRIGFISGDLRTHPVGFFLESVVAHLDPQRFELVAYVTKPGEDALSARIKAYFAEWHSLLGLSDAAAAGKIHHDDIHILIDLAGHTADNRLPVMAYKPAPVQVAWLGYFASTGVAAIDYILADWQVLPLGEESHFVETPWRLPDCYLCFTAPQERIEVNPLPSLSNGYVTFGCFNKLSKMNDAVVALWARVLHAVPQSRLLLQAKELSNLTARTLTLERFAAHAIGAERIELEGYTDRARYLENYHRVDIGLDPFPFPGGTTTVEALWMGVPILSGRGSRFLSHAGESLLKTAGLPEWIAVDNEDYVRKAQAYAADLTALAELRAGLRNQLLASPLCDAPRFAANLGLALNGMWQRYVESATDSVTESATESATESTTKPAAVESDHE